MVKYKEYLFFVFYLFSAVLYGQQTPYNPVSSRIFTPEIFNPAVTGSKEFPTLTFNSDIDRARNTQILNGQTRLEKKHNTSLLSPDITSFSNFGTGGYIFHNTVDSVRNIGLGVSGSYHLAMNRSALSFLSFGITLKGLYSHAFSQADVLDTTDRSIFHPDMDIGVYYYCPDFYAGVSVTSLFSGIYDSIALTKFRNNVLRQYTVNAGYRFVISRQNALVLEPFVFFNFGETSLDQSSYHFHPGLKFYYKESYFGAYVNDPHNLAMLFHLQFPGFFVGSYIEFPVKSDIRWNNKKLFLEISAGINLGKNKKTFKRFW